MVELKKYAFFTLILLFLIAGKAFSDEMRYTMSFTSENDRYTFRLRGYEENSFPDLNNEEWEMLDNETGRIQFSVEGSFVFLTVYVADDGKHFVAVDDFSMEDYKTADVLWFYDKDKLVKTYSLKDLLNDVTNISQSVSHFDWCFSPSLEDKNFYLKTYELKNICFDIRTGKVKKSFYDEILHSRPLYAYGILNHIKDDLYSFEVKHLVSGKVEQNPTQITYKPTKKIRDGKYITLIIKDGAVIGTNDVLFNLCNYQNAR